jgi:hypothetical protein
MKKLFVIACLFLPALSVLSQETSEEEAVQKGFRRDNIFIGGSLGLGLGSGTFNISANPEIGYTITKWLDAGISTNINYFTVNADNNRGYRQRSTTYGAGVFVRIYPINGFFIQAIPEYNWMNTKLKDVTFGTGQDLRFKAEAPSLLLGVGYGRRAIGNSNFFTAIMFDAGSNDSSPYINTDQDQNGNIFKSKLPIIRTGFNIYLRPKSQK